MKFPVGTILLTRALHRKQNFFSLAWYKNISSVISGITNSTVYKKKTFSKQAELSSDGEEDAVDQVVDIEDLVGGSSKPRRQVERKVRQKPAVHRSQPAKS